MVFCELNAFVFPLYVFHILFIVVLVCYGCCNKLHRFNALKKHRFILLESGGWKTEGFSSGWNLGVGRAGSLGGSGGESVSGLFWLRESPLSLMPGLIHLHSQQYQLSPSSGSSASLFPFLGPLWAQGSIWIIQKNLSLRSAGKQQPHPPAPSFSLSGSVTYSQVPEHRMRVLNALSTCLEK